MYIGGSNGRSIQFRKAINVNRKKGKIQRIVKQPGEMNVKWHISDTMIFVDKRPREASEYATFPPWY